MRSLIDDGRSGATHSLERGREFSVGCPRGMRQTAVGSYNEPQDGERATALDRGCNDRPEPLETPPEPKQTARAARGGSQKSRRRRGGGHDGAAKGVPKAQQTMRPSGSHGIGYALLRPNDLRSSRSNRELGKKLRATLSAPAPRSTVYRTAGLGEMIAL